MTSSVDKKEEGTSETKELLQNLNVTAVAKLLTDMRDDNHKIRSEQVGLHPIISQATQDITELRARINELKALGARGTMGGTGSTVHLKGE